MAARPPPEPVDGRPLRWFLILGRLGDASKLQAVACGPSVRGQGDKGEAAVVYGDLGVGGQGGEPAILSFLGFGFKNGSHPRRPGGNTGTPPGRRSAIAGRFRAVQWALGGFQN